MQATDASGRWTELDNKRESLRRRWETYASYTVPHVCPDRNYNQLTDELNHDYQSVGAQAVNSLANKIMLALFAPSRPFFKMDPDEKTKKELADVGVDPEQLKEIFSAKELESVKYLDSKNIRPIMFEIIKSLIVTGNALMVVDKDEIRYVKVSDYVVKRDFYGRVTEIMTRACLQYDQLTKEVQDYVTQETPGRKIDDAKCDMYRWYKLDDTGTRMEMTQWVDQIKLKDKKFTGSWKRDKCPVRSLTWIISSNADYGTGLVEDYSGDFAALSTMSVSFVQGNVLASEFRWLANPGGQTNPQEIAQSQNGAVVPGVAGDLELISAGQGMGQTLQTMMNGMDMYSRRIAQGFLMMGQTTRDAERVTAEEIRMQANELENSLGGAYSRLAIDMQLPLADWLLEKQDMSVEGVGITVSIVTGLNALSRNGDLDNLKAAIGDVGMLYQQNPVVLQALKVDSIISDMFAGRGLMSSRYVKTQAEMSQEAQQAQQQQIAAQGAMNVVDQATAPQPTN